MNRQAIGLVFIAALATQSWAKQKPADVDDKLVGTRVITSAEFMETLRPAPDDSSSFTFTKDGKCIMKEKGRPDKVSLFKVATTKNPKEIDLIDPESDVDKRTTKTIYQVDGDTLKIVGTKGPGSDRPTAFDPKQGYILTCKRQKP